MDKQPSRPSSPFSSAYTEADDDEPADFPSAELEAAHFRARYLEIYRTLQDTKAELDDFQASSKELEEELERELASTESVQADLRARVGRLEGEKDEWKNKYLAAQKSHNLALGSLQRELDEVKAEKERYRTSLRDLEMGVDDLERNERMVSSSLNDMEARYNRAIEDKTLLEQELIGKVQVEEEVQRLKDEINELYTEVAVLKQQRFQPPPSPTRSATPPSARGGPASRPSGSTSSSSLNGHTEQQHPLMSPVKESSRELSMSDLTFLGDTTGPHAASTSPFKRDEDEGDDDVLSPSPFHSVLSPLPPPPPPPPPSAASRALPSSPLPRSTSSPAFARLGAGSPSRLPLVPGSPSALPRSTTARNLNGSLARAANNGLSSPLSPAGVRPRQPLAPRTLNPATATASNSTRSRGVKMVSDLGERVRTLQSRIQTHRDPTLSSGAAGARHRAPSSTPAGPAGSSSSSSASGRTSSSRPSSMLLDGRPGSAAAANPRMRALAEETDVGGGRRSSGRGGPLSPGTPGTPGTSDWVLVSDAENSPTPASGSAPPSPPPTQQQPAPRSSFSSGLRQSMRSSSSKAAGASTTTLPSRPGIPSPLGVSRSDPPTRRPSSRTGDRPSSRAGDRPSSRLGERPSSSLGQNPPHVRPVTPSSLPVPRRQSLSSSRPASPALGSNPPSTSTIAFPSTSFTSSSSSGRLPPISHPRPLGTTTTRAVRPPSTFGGSYVDPSLSSSTSSALKRSTRRTSLVDSSIPSPPASSTLRHPAPRSSLGASSSRSRPVSAPVPPRDPPPVPTVPSHLASKRHAVLVPTSRVGLVGRKRSSTGGSEGQLMNGGGGHRP